MGRPNYSFKKRQKELAKKKKQEEKRLRKQGLKPDADSDTAPGEATGEPGLLEEG